MIRIAIALLLLLIPAEAFSGVIIRRFSTIAKMIQMNPQASAVSGKLTAEVAGYYDEGDWVERPEWSTGWLAARSS